MMYVLPNLSLEWGSSKDYAAFIVTITSACEFFGRLILFTLTGYFGISAYKFLNTCLLTCISAGVAVYFSSPTVLLVHGVIHGFFALIFVPLMTLLIKVQYI